MKKKVKIIIMTTIMFFLLIDNSQNVAAAERMEWETPSGISGNSIEAVIDEIAENGIGTKTGGISVAIVKDGRIAFLKGYGMADIENHIPVYAEKTVFEYGSVSKLFTWVSLMQLCEEGKIDLYEDIKNYLPEDFNLNLRYEKPVTALDLMNHSAGFDDYFIGLLSRDDDIPGLRNALMDNKVRQINEPGYVSSYSNYGAGLAGYIVENVEGKDEYNYIQENIFDRLHMNAVSINPHPEDKIITAKSKAYRSDGAKLTKADWSYVPMYPAGAANGTVIELAKFAAALMDTKSGLFVKPDTYNELFQTSYTDHEDVAGVAHGFFEYDGECRSRAFWHNGGTENFSSFFAVVPEENFGVIALANSEDEDGITLPEKIATICLDSKYVTLDVPEENLPDPKEVAGNYYLQRRCTHGISKLGNLFSLTDVKVRKCGGNQITVNGALYKQVKPYVYQKQDDGSKGCFVMEKGKTVKFFKSQDYAAVPFKSFVGYGITYAVSGGWLLSLLVVLPFFFAEIIGKLMHKSMKTNDRIQKATGISFLLWFVMEANIVIIVNRISGLVDFAAIRPQIVLNIVIAVLMLPEIWIIISESKRICSRWRRFIYGFFGGTAACMLVILGMWGIYNPMS